MKDDNKDWDHVSDFPWVTMLIVAIVLVLILV